MKYILYLYPTNQPMKKKYFYITLLLLFMFSVGAAAQESRASSSGKTQESIDGLNIYPNPVSTGRIYITSKSAENKDVEIFDVLGKRILQASLSSKELNISSLTPGVYIIKIKEGEASATRKLIVK